MARFAAVLSLICVVAALVLGVTYNVTRPLIAQQAEQEKQDALRKVLPGADKYTDRVLPASAKYPDFLARGYYEGYKDSGLLGYVISCAAEGYAGPIEMLVGIDTTGTITGLWILSHQETPGLGSRCVEIKYGQDNPWFLRQFAGRKARELSLKDIQAITGATITSDGVVKAVSKAVAAFLDLVEETE